MDIRQIHNRNVGRCTIDAVSRYLQKIQHYSPAHSVSLLHFEIFHLMTPSDLYWTSPSVQNLAKQEKETKLKQKTGKSEKKRMRLVQKRFEKH